MRHSPRTIHPDGLRIRTTVNQKICERLQQRTLNRLTVPMKNAGEATQSVCLSAEGLMLRTSKRGAARRRLRPECVPLYPELGFESLLGGNPILPGPPAGGNRVMLTESRNLPQGHLGVLSAKPLSPDLLILAFQYPNSLDSLSGITPRLSNFVQSGILVAAFALATSPSHFNIRDARARRFAGLQTLQGIHHPAHLEPSDADN